MQEIAAEPRRLLFLPGAGGDPGFWRPLGELLPRDWPKTYLSWPGLGKQPPAADVHGFVDFARLVEAAMADGPVNLLGQSMGGAIALWVALKWPGRVRKLVLSATSGGLNVAALGAADWRTEYWQEYPAVDPHSFDGWPDLTPELPGLSQPVLLLWGDADPISPLAVGQRLAQLIPRAHLQVIPGGNHDFASKNADRIATAVLRHLA